MFEVQSQDFRRWRPGDPKPKVVRETFADEAEARKRYVELKYQTIMVTMRPLVLKSKPASRQTALKDPKGEKFNSAWRLHK